MKAALINLPPRLLSWLFAVSMIPVSVSCEREEHTSSSIESSAKFKARERTNASNGKQAESVSPDLIALRERLEAELQFAKLMEAGEEQEREIARIAWDSLESAPELAQLAAMELPEDQSERTSLLQILAQNKALLDPEEAQSWANSLENPAEKNAALEQVSLVIKQVDPRRALELLPENADSGLSPAAAPILQGWASTDPQRAIRWLSGMSSGEKQSSGFKVVFDQWLNNEPVEAFKWASLQTSPKVRLAVIRSITKALSERVDDSRDALLNEASPGIRHEIENELERLNAEKQDAQKRVEEDIESEIRKDEEPIESDIDRRGRPEAEDLE